MSLAYIWEIGKRKKYLLGFSLVLHRVDRQLLRGVIDLVSMCGAGESLQQVLSLSTLTI